MTAAATYKVWFRSVPGMFEQYDGAVTVNARSLAQAIDAGYAKLRTSYPERGRAMWKVIKVEIVGGF